MRQFLMRRIAILLLLFLAGCVVAPAQQTAAEHLADRAAQRELNESPRDGNIRSYRLSPENLLKAEHLEHVDTALALGGTVWSLLVLWGLLHFGVIARFERVAQRYTRVFPQGFRFALLLLLATTVLSFPIAIYRHVQNLRFGLSVQGWASWAGDQGKSFVLAYCVGGLLAVLAIRCLRKSSRWWWLRFWIIALPFALAALLLTPYIIDPLFNHFEPLNATHPELVKRLQAVADRGHMNIPAERMFLMRASEKSTTMNAYVTGFGPSKRVVVWDTSIDKGSIDQLLFIFGHESGHYVLNHVLWGTVEAALGTLLLLYLCHAVLPWTLHRFGHRWQITSMGQWGTVGVLLLLFSIFSSLSEPIAMAMSRSKEHAADVYGQEAVHGLVANSQETARGAFQVLGQTSYDDPNPSPIVEWWTYSHPSIGRRAAFAAHYNPWEPGLAPRYFPRR